MYETYTHQKLKKGKQQEKPTDYGTGLVEWMKHTRIKNYKKDKNQEKPTDYGTSLLE